MTRILFYSPYSAWTYHAALEATWAHALRLRGAEARFLVCNGLSGACDVYREGINPRGEYSCLECQSNVAGIFHKLSNHYEWLGDHVSLRTRAKAQEWAQRVPRAELLEARWRGMEVGSWAATSAYYQFRSLELDLDDPHVERSVRNLLAGTVVVLEGMESVLDDYQPDALVLLNGRFFGHWTALELAKRRGIRFVTHERGLSADSVRFNVDSRTHELDELRALWEEWRDVPLDAEEVAQAARTLEDRRQGRNFSRLSFSPALQERERVRQALSLDDRPVVVVFNSSDDETAAFPERRAGAFPESRDFLPAVLEHARTRPGVQFVIRIHPNIEQRRAGTNQGALLHAQEIQRRAPENVRVVMPRDDVSSYTLIDLADVGLAYASTVGLEMAATGKPVLCVAQATYSHTGCARQIDAPDELGSALDEALAHGVDPEVARVALRWTYRFFRDCAIPFDLVHGPPDDGAAQLRFRSVAELAPGRHETLDRICSLLLGESRTVLPGASEAQRRRPLEAETRAVECWLSAQGSGSPLATS